jgi:outer membrane protein assembly factor BamB
MTPSLLHYALWGASLEFHHGRLVSCSPAVAGGCVYIGSYDNNLYCLNAVTGEQIWNCTLFDSIHSSPAIYNGKIYVGGWDYFVYCFGAEPPAGSSLNLSLEVAAAIAVVIVGAGVVVVMVFKKRKP